VEAARTVREATAVEAARVAVEEVATAAATRASTATSLQARAHPPTCLSVYARARACASARAYARACAHAYTHMPMHRPLLPLSPSTTLTLLLAAAAFHRRQKLHSLGVRSPRGNAPAVQYVTHV
jgi:hypothetical protein